MDGHGVGLNRVDEVRASTAAVVLRRGDRVLKVSPQGLLVLAIHGTLRHDLELGLVAIAGANMLKGVQELKVFVIALVAKLVARETKDSELVAVLLRQGIQLNEIPDGRTSHGRDIVNEDDLTLELGEVKLRAIDWGAASPTTEGLALEVVERRLGADRGALSGELSGAIGQARGSATRKLRGQRGEAAAGRQIGRAHV